MPITMRMTVHRALARAITILISIMWTRKTIRLTVRAMRNMSVRVRGRRSNILLHEPIRNRNRERKRESFEITDRPQLQTRHLVYKRIDLLLHRRRLGTRHWLAIVLRITRIRKDVRERTSVTTIKYRAISQSYESKQMVCNTRRFASKTCVWRRKLTRYDIFQSGRTHKAAFDENRCCPSAASLDEFRREDACDLRLHKHPAGAGHVDVRIH